MRSGMLVVNVGILLAAFSHSALGQSCAGDCDDDGKVSINELITGVNIALGKLSPATCPALDANDSDFVEIAELIAAVNGALCGCGQACPTPIPRPTSTATPTYTMIPIYTPTPPMIGQVLFHEGWERAGVRRYTPDSIFGADTGDWFVGDTVSSFPECGVSPHFVEVIVEEGNRRMRLHSGQTDGGCADNVFLGPVVRNPPALRNLNIPVTEDLYLSFLERGALDGVDSCDAVFLHVEFDQASRLSYVLQRGSGWATNRRSWGCGGTLFTPNPFLLGEGDGTYVRNILDDALAADLQPPRRLTSLSLEVDSGGEATFDDITVFRAGP